MEHQRERGPDRRGEILYGRQALLETLRAGRRPCRRLWLAEGVRLAGLPSEIVREARRRGVAVGWRPRADLDRMTASGNHQGVVLEADPFPWADCADVVEASTRRDEPPFLLALDHIQDPQNVGSVMRTAEAAGVHGVILPREGACGITPAVVRASSGAVEHMAVGRTADLAGLLLELRRRGIQCLALESDPAAPRLDEQRLTGGVALAVGGEGTGVRRNVIGACDAVVRLPMRGRVGSLNAAVAAAIAMFEVRRQRDRAGMPGATR